MKIAIITPFYPPSIGGVETIARDTAEELAQRRYDVSIITTTHSNAWVKIAQSGVEVDNDVTIYRLKPNFVRVGYATFMEGIKEIIKKVKPDVVHSHNLHPHLFQAIELKNELNYNLITQLHYPEATGIDHISAKLMYMMATWYLKIKQQKINAFIAHTNLEKAWLISKGFNEQRVYKLNYPCVPSTLFKKKSKNYNIKTERKLGFPEKEILLYVGRITRRKGIHILLQALPDVINEVKDVLTVIAGPADEKYYRMLLKLANRLNLNHKVVFKQLLSEEEKYNCMFHCSVFVSPSIKDYTPVTLVEAQALGKPVISTTVGAIPEIIRNHETGLLVEPENPRKLAEAITWLILNKKKMEAMGIKARQWVEKNFLLNTTVNKLEKLYTDCSNR